MSSATSCVTSVGTTSRIACGRITRRIATPSRIPSAAAASAWPRSTAFTPARKISASTAVLTSTIGTTSLARIGRLIPNRGRASRNA